MLNSNARRLPVLFHFDTLVTTHDDDKDNSGKLLWRCFLVPSLSLYSKISQKTSDYNLKIATAE